MDQIIDMLGKMKSDSLSNYVLAGLNSHMLNNGNVRYFENTRDDQVAVTPHSHRFDFVCLVLSGHVVNIIWVDCKEGNGDFFEEAELIYKGKPGQYERKTHGRDHYKPVRQAFNKGECYSMTSDQIHSIEFSKDANVLFFEGPQVAGSSIILEPVVNGEAIPTFETKEWMFKPLTA